jgi:hypothetical protein
MHTVKTCGGVEAQIRPFLTWQLAAGEWSPSRSGHFTPGKEPPVPIEEEAGHFQQDKSLSSLSGCTL